jgi:Na+/melibiose symporter-like transporter
MGGSSLAGFVVSTFLLKTIGYEVFFFISSGMTCISLFLLYSFKAEPILKKDVVNEDDIDNDEKLN